MTGIGENTLAQPVKPPLRERRACLAKLVKNRLTLTNGATEQVFGHIKDEFFRGRTWPDFESFKADLDDFVVHWNTRRRQVKLKGLTPEEFRRQSLAA
ncbi:IS3 family transposase [Collinsella sp. HCP28S3_E12]|uniref:IS3 family transposase n=1 Tax=Collinsella sp. HCP28S3_E12 TaxID=3438921 RepID=UPI003F88938C